MSTASPQGTGALTITASTARKRSLWSREHAGTSIEYAVMLGLLAAVIIAAAAALLGSTRSMTQTVANTLVVGGDAPGGGSADHLGRRGTVSRRVWKATDGEDRPPDEVSADLNLNEGAAPRRD
jgi:Flp pilus assembly pilin Flp